MVTDTTPTHTNFILAYVKGNILNKFKIKYNYEVAKLINSRALQPLLTAFSKLRAF